MHTENKENQNSQVPDLEKLAVNEEEKEVNDTINRIITVNACTAIDILDTNTEQHIIKILRYRITNSQ